MLSRKSSASIVAGAQQACTDERKAYQLSMLRRPIAPGAAPLDGPAFADALAEADRQAVRHVVAFLAQVRPAGDHD